MQGLCSKLKNQLKNKYIGKDLKPAFCILADNKVEPLLLYSEACFISIISADCRSMSMKLLNLHSQLQIPTSEQCGGIFSPLMTGELKLSAILHSQYLLKLFNHWVCKRM